MKHHYLRCALAFSLIIVMILCATLSSSAQSNCVAPLGPPPHQGGGKFGSAIFGVQADITEGNPTFGCEQNWDSYSNEWVMIVGPGSNAWIQLGWERDSQFFNTAVHFWYQTRNPNLTDPVDYPIIHGRTYKIEAVGDPDPNVGTYWYLYADNVYLAAIPASDLGWPAGSNYGVNMQWSGEVNYVESDMGAIYPYRISIVYPMWNLGSGYADITSPYFFNSWHPRYTGDAHQFSDQTWLFQNWSRYPSFLPLILK